MGGVAPAVIRFMPDTWWDVAMRPLDMISPDANMYVEIAAPDLRLAAALVLGAAVLLCGRRAHGDRRAALLLLVLTLTAAVPWLATTGNGRYFTPFLLLLGPLCAGLARLLPLSRSMKFSMAAALLAGQGFLVYESSPWGAWSLVPWQEAPYFEVSGIPAEPRSYVTISSISYSLIAPQFPDGSRWMNANAPLGGEKERGYARDWLAASTGPLTLLAPTLATQMVDGHQPSEEVARVFNNLLAGKGMSFDPGSRCEFLPSRGLVKMAFGPKPIDPAKDMSRFGFWACPIRYDPRAWAHPAAAAPALPHPADAVFEAVEKLCPRFFRPGEAQTQLIEEGAARQYSLSDTHVYVLDDGRVLYKFWRSLNAELIGTREQVLAGKVHLDCSRIRSSTWRTGGP